MGGRQLLPLLLRIEEACEYREAVVVVGPHLREERAAGRLRGRKLIGELGRVDLAGIYG